MEELESVDPTEFLAQEDEDEDGEDHPPILTSLGLTHINHVYYKKKDKCGCNIFFYNTNI